MFADDLELASHLEQQRIEKAIADALAKKPVTLPAIGECHNCGEPMQAGLGSATSSVGMTTTTG